MRKVLDKALNCALKELDKNGDDPTKLPLALHHMAAPIGNIKRPRNSKNRRQT